MMAKNSIFTCTLLPSHHFRPFLSFKQSPGCTGPAQAFALKQSQAVPAWQKHFS